MKISANTTGFDTIFLRTVICRVHNHLAVHEGRLYTWKYLKVSIWNRRHGTSGHAHLSGLKMHLSIAPTTPTDTFTWLVYHEFMHLYGYRHGQFTDAKPETIKEICTGLPGLMPIRQAVTKVEPDIVRHRFSLMVTAVERWERKARLAENRLRAAKAKLVQYRSTYEASGRLDGLLSPKPSLKAAKSGSKKRRTAP